MTTPDANDAAPSPDYSGDSDMAERKVEQSQDDASPSQRNGNGQKPASSAKDPLRPRRKKARRACFACQRAHLTCGDERPCHRCIKRGLQDHCMDGVRKKAKYLHDAPDGALMPGVGGNYSHLNGGHATSLPTQDSGAVSMSQQGGFYTQAPSTTYYAQNSTQAQIPPTVQEAPVMNAFNNQQAPISPPYSQTNPASISNVPSTVSQAGPSQMHQFGGPLFDPSDPALFNFDISSLNFGNHYGALEMGILGHMSSGAADTPPSDSSLLNPLNQAANVFNPQMPSGHYSDPSAIPPNMSFGPDGLPSAEWQNAGAHSRHGSLQIQTPHNTPITTTIDHNGHRNDSLNGPHAYAIGQGPSSLSSASPASTGIDSGYDNENPMSAAAFFANAHPPQAQHSPTVSRLQLENRALANTALQPIQSNAIRKRRRDTSYIYEGITKPYDHSIAFHRLALSVQRRYPAEKARKVRYYLSKFRPVLLKSATELDTPDLIHQEKNLQRSLLTLEDMIAETGTPVLVCRRSGEVVLSGKEFSILTGWKRDILLGKETNMNVNIPSTRDPSSDSGLSSRTSTTPMMTGQEPDTGPHPVSIVDLMDEDSVVQWFEDFSELAYDNSRGTTTRRVKMLKYRTKEDMAKLEEIKANAVANGKPSQPEPQVKMENAIHAEAGIGMLGARDGMVDCMICWHIKRDNFDMPMLVVMNILPVLA
ncbi:uncharacterized protein BDR25DRAFT_14791 [Lindgomyces ingoldianus]|uniref:Uncharacterized protein n=1 Tax=Lindgomyces ingoldianus TaxID=673940 RepID=A0ACB6QZR8_9PLEO|nr:uncharacterized protein BDR25DRAFT_14791 [Lindgomyces ingoldianus]KAF2472498.1 hypothetical protein BDR25DRAFT_14791 [Lindgomyces ingoldianus]